MKFKVDEITSVIRQEIANYRNELDVKHVGKVLEVGDGIARIYGLSDAMAGEMLQFESGAFGQVFNLEEDSVGAVVFGDFEHVKEGDSVRGLGRLLEVPVGRAMLGRVIDPLGKPLDGGGDIVADETRPIERIAPGLAARQPVNEPLQTGIKAIDSMIPIGRGQRELIIGDRKTGKTAIAIDTIINQKNSGVICVYVAVGQKESTVVGVVETLRRHGAMDYTIVVVATSADPAPLQYIAPYAGCTIAEYFMYTQGAATLCVYDDLSKQAAAYRQLSLLLRRPPGREAYPGDVFYLHSRLLERSVKMADEFVIVPASTAKEAINRAKAVDGKVYMRSEGQDQARKDLAKLPNKDQLKVEKIPSSGGSLTALPIIETLEGEVSAYIPTNVISITDGQIYLDPDLFFAGVRPAINVGISVSRVGAKAQIKAMKKVAGSLRLDLAAFRELEAFAQLGTELDPATQRQLDRGERMVELLKQPQYQPYEAIDQAISLFAGTHGFLDDIPLPDSLRFERELLEYVKGNQAEMYQKLKCTGDLPDAMAEQLTKAIKQFKLLFRPAGQAGVPTLVVDTVASPKPAVEVAKV